MGLLENKGWIVQDFFNEYLDLKRDIQELVQHQQHFARHNRTKEVNDYQVDIDEKVKRLKFVLNELKFVHGIAMEDLILLSIGIDV